MAGEWTRPARHRRHWLRAWTRSRPRTAGAGTLRVTTDNLLPGYIRKNGVPHSDHAVLNEYFNVVTGPQGESYFVVTAMVDDPMYLNGPFIRTYNFKKQQDASGWDPTPCLPK